jgi:putative transposase
LVNMGRSKNGIVLDVAIRQQNLVREDRRAMHKEYQRQNGFAVKVPYFDITCKFCGSRNVIKYGHYRNIQRFFCKDCQRKFADNDALPDMKTPIDQVGTAISMYYEGQSLSSICRLLAQIYHSYPSDSTIYRWIAKFTKQAVNEAKDYKLNVGDVWVCDETVLDIDGRNVWFWDIIDAKTRFLLASRLSRSRTTKDAALLMNEARRRAGKSPKTIITDKLAAYLDGIEYVFGSSTEHIRSQPFTVENNTNLIERFHGTLKDRTKIMRGLKDFKSARLITDGWLLHYNYLRPHEALEGKTPAEVAGVKYPYHNWQEVVAKREVITPAKISATSAMIIPELHPRFKRVMPKRKFGRLHRQREKPMQMVAVVRY